MASGLVPHPTNQNLYIIIGIIGATVMPHNLYLHSALVQTRRIGQGDAQKRTACRFNLIDSVVALNGAMLVNIAILVVAGAVFFERHIVAIALLCSGQSSTMTGTMAGQIVMEGFLTIRMRPWLRRLTTRTLAIVPAALTIWIAGEQSSLRLLILSQVILSMQLPFAVIPLIHFTSDPARMGAFANRRWLQALSWVVAAVILGLNVRLVALTLSDWLASAGPYRDLVMMTVEPVLILLALLLAWIGFEPWLPGWLRRKGRAAVPVPAPVAAEVRPFGYRTILVPLDHTERDRVAIAHAASMARSYGSKLHLLHVEEGVTSQVYGPLSSTAEVQAGAKYLDEILEGLRAQGIQVELSIAHSMDPKQEIIRFSRWLKPDLLIMGAHGHRGIQDIVFGQTINAVRHALDTPLLIVRHEGEPR